MSFAPASSATEVVVEPTPSTMYRVVHYGYNGNPKVAYWGPQQREALDAAVTAENWGFGVFIERHDRDEEDGRFLIVDTVTAKAPDLLVATSA